MLKLRVTEEAQNDILEIGLYTQEEWGEEQRRAYLNDLNDRLQWLRECSHLGKERDDIHKGYWSYTHAKHIIFYRVNNNDLEIIGVLHGSMEHKNHF